MRKRFMAKVAAATALPLAAGGIAYAAGTFHEVKPHAFDPAHTFLVTSGWVNGIGCPSNAKTSSDGTHLDGTYSDQACATGSDKNDPKNQGLLLNKVGPTNNFASATAELKDVAGIKVTELGYDIRKPAGAADPRGSHCGAGAPRFNVTYADGSREFIGCSSPPADTEQVGTGWTRLRWNLSGKAVKSIRIIFDEGTDTGPDNFGLAVLDNIDVNGVVVGHGDKGNVS